MLSDFTYAFAIPIVFLLLIVGVFGRILKPGKMKEEAFNVVLGVALGVMLGFVADITKRSYDDFQQTRKLKVASLALLENDARQVFRTLWLHDTLIKAKHVPSRIKPRFPPFLEMHYWTSLKQSNDFLLLSSEEPFRKIFWLMWEFEKLNGYVVAAKAGDPKATQIATVVCGHLIDRQIHRELLSLFLSEKEIEELIREYLDMAKDKGASS